MIKDILSNADLYANIHPAFPRAFAWLREHDLSAMKPGRYELDGDRLYVSIQTPETRDWEGADFETHDRYIDIQYIIDGAEVIGYAPREALTPATSYDNATDFMLWSGDGDRALYRVGDFAVFFPDDAHKPIVHPAGVATTVKKAVVKVHVL